MKIKRKSGRDHSEQGDVKRSIFYSVLFLLLFIGSLPVKSQCEAENNAFSPGEMLTYDLYFNWKFIWIKAGDARLTTQNTTYQAKAAYRMDLYAITNKRADRFFKMRDTITSIFSKKLEPIYFRKGAEEGKGYTVDEGHFSYKNGLAFVDQKRIKKDGSLITSQESDSRCIYDMLSILAQARSFNPDNYVLGQRINFPMATGRKVEEQILIYRGREEFEANNDITYRCLVFSLVEMKNNKEKEVITFYITDDKNHLPVRLDMFLNFGSAKAFLKTTQGNRHPITSIVTKK